MSPLVAEVVMLVPVYLLGGIPFSLLIGKVFFRTDLRTRGSGNLGATNTYRELGVVAGAAVLVLDAAKGTAAAALAAWGVPRLSGVPFTELDAYMLLVTFVVIAGHMYSPYLGFRGGKGVAAAAGALAYIMPEALLVLAAVFVVVVAISRMISLGSVAVAVIFPILTYALYSKEPAVMVLATLAAVLVIWRHRSNLSRIIKGEEPRLGRKRP